MIPVASAQDIITAIISQRSFLDRFICRSGNDAKIVKKTNSYKGDRYIIYGQVTQFDSATGDDNLLADTAHPQHHELRILRRREHSAHRQIRSKSTTWPRMMSSGPQ